MQQQLLFTQKPILEVLKPIEPMPEKYNSYIDGMWFQYWWGSTCPQLTYEKALNKYIEYLITKDIEKIIEKYKKPIRFSIINKPANTQKTRKNKKC